MAFLTIMLVIFLAIFVSEYVLDGFWIRAYVSTGIPLFSKKIDVSGCPNASEKIAGRIQSFGEAGKFEELKRKAIDGKLFFFRGRLDRKVSDFVHGNIRIDAEQKSVTVKGLAGLCDVLCLLWLVVLHAACFKDAGLFSGYSICYVGLFGSMGIEYWKCKKLAAAIRSGLNG